MVDLDSAGGFVDEVVEGVVQVREVGVTVSDRLLAFYGVADVSGYEKVIP